MLLENKANDLSTYATLHKLLENYSELKPKLQRLHNMYFYLYDIFIMLKLQTLLLGGQ